MNFDPERFSTASLEAIPWKEQVTRILSAALESVDPAQAMRRHIRRENNRLIVSDRTYQLEDYQEVLVVGAGKAGASMASAITELLGDRITRGFVIVKKGHLPDKPFTTKIEVHEASHPVPGEDSMIGAEKLIRLLKDTNRKDLIIFLLSGGASALMTLPPTGMTLDDMRSLTSLLLACGAGITEINTVRKHLDQAKGGRLVSFAPGAQWITFILSDVIGDPLDQIGSGPSAPDPTTYQQALAILEKYQITRKVSSSIVSHLQDGTDGKIPETPKPGDPAFFKAQHVIIANNRQACQAAQNQAKAEGFNAAIVTTYLQGEAREAGKFIAAIAREVSRHHQPFKKPACLILGGETSVTLKGGGKGGRNQEMALAASIDVADLPDVVIITLASDGQDGPTDAAGAVVTAQTLSRAQQKGLSPIDFLQRNDSYRFFQQLNDLIQTGPTLTNVNDLAFIFVKDYETL